MRGKRGRRRAGPNVAGRKQQTLHSNQKQGQPASSQRITVHETATKAGNRTRHWRNLFSAYESLRANGEMTNVIRRHLNFGNDVHRSDLEPGVAAENSRSV
jgi:hypothetical protein